MVRRRRGGCRRGAGSGRRVERSRGRRFAVRLGANELTFGPSEKAVRAMAEASSSAWMYGDPKSYELRAALSDQHGVDPLNIVGSLPAEDQFQFEEKELLNGRLAMIGMVRRISRPALPLRGCRLAAGGRADARGPARVRSRTGAWHTR